MIRNRFIANEPSYPVKIYLAGPIEQAKQIIRGHVWLNPLCVTIEPTTFIYTGGEEAGYVVGLVNYPRFPSTPDKIFARACHLADLLMDETFQRTALVVAPDTTQWLHWEEASAE